MNEHVIAGEINYRRVREFSEFMLTCDMSEELVLKLCSQGGDEGCGRAIAGMLKFAQKLGMKVTVEGYGDIHSAAVIVFAAGGVRKLSHAATVMVHESTVEETKNSSGFKKLSKQMEADEEFWCALLEQYTGTDKKIWMNLHEKETYLRPDECLKLNFATEII